MAPRHLNIKTPRYDDVMTATQTAVAPKVKHSATWTPALLDRIAAILGCECDALGRRVTVLDNHAGTGHKVAEHLGIQLCSDWLGIELEPEWANVSEWVMQGDSDRLYPGWSQAFGALVTSPDYGNRLSDHHNAKDGSRRMSYTQDLRTTTGDPDRKLRPGNTGVMGWGPAYRASHTRRLIEGVRCVRPGGLVIINMSDHIRKGEIVPVVDWWRAMMVRIGLSFVHDWVIDTPRLKYGENRQRVDGEHLLVFRRPDDLDVCLYQVEASQVRLGELVDGLGEIHRIEAKPARQIRLVGRSEVTVGKADLIDCSRRLVPIVADIHTPR